MNRICQLAKALACIFKVKLKAMLNISLTRFGPIYLFHIQLTLDDFTKASQYIRS